MVYCNGWDLDHNELHRPELGRPKVRISNALEGKGHLNQVDQIVRLISTDTEILVSLLNTDRDACFVYKEE